KGTMGLRGMVLLLLAWPEGSARAETPLPAPSASPRLEVPAAAALPPGRFEVKAATDAWLAKVPADKRARSDAYFEGGYWLILWDFLYGAAISLALLALGWSARLRDLAERMTRFRALQAVLYWTEYALLTTLLSF